MIVRMLACCTVVAALATNVAAEEAKWPPDKLDKKFAELDAKISELETKTAGLETAAADLTTVAQNQKAKLEELEKRQTATENTLTETLEQLRLLKEETSQTTTVLNEQIATQQQILDAISKKDSAGNPVPVLSANMSKSKDFAQDVRDAVHNSLEKQGKFTVTNKTSSYRLIWVNRVEYGVAPGDSITLATPVGTVATQLPGKELKTWTLGAPDYEEHIEIVPETRTAYYPTAPVYVEPSPPAYVSPPIYVDPAPPVFYLPYF